VSDLIVPAELPFAGRYAVQVLLGSRLISEWAVYPRRLVGCPLYLNLRIILSGRAKAGAFLPWILHSSLVGRSN